MILMYKLIIGALVSVFGFGATYFATKSPKESKQEQIAQKAEEIVDKAVIKKQE